MKSKKIMTLAAFALAVGLAGFATTGCGLDVPGSLVAGDTTSTNPGFDDDGPTPGPGGTNVVPLGDSTLELEGAGR